MRGTWKPLGSTDAEGRFRLTDLSPGPVDVEVIARGYQPKRLEGLRIPEDQDVQGLEIVLGRSTTVRVKVVTARGEPVAGAWVRADPETASDLESLRLRSTWHAQDDRTDERGLCLVEVPKPGRYRISASLQGPPAREVVEAGPAGASVELRLDPGVEISGRVVDEEGAGIAGASVSLENTEASGVVSSFEVSSDADGAFLHRGIRDGTIRLKASRKGYAEAVHPEAVTVAGHSVYGIEIRLTQDETYGNAVITGRLLGLSPEDTARVRVSARAEPFFQGTPGKVTDGVYRIEGLKPGEWKVTASTPSGHKAGTSTRIDPGVTEVAADLEFSGFTLSGRALVDGTPLARAKLIARGKAPEVFGQTSTDHAGNFVLRNLPRGTYHLILGPEEGIGDVRSLDLAEDQTVALRISTGKIAGRLVSGTTGEPFPDTAIQLDGWSQVIDYFFSVPSTRSDESGAFESVRLAPGTYKLKVRKEGFAPAEATATVQPGKTTEVTISLTPID